ncbi:DUF3999 family protein [Massilia sp. W12]|uniref:DUF3999 family protein n=1 Tax=Massilia sp. W12 TaxID=3126507 RepID=UPI0030D5AF60
MNRLICGAMLALGAISAGSYAAGVEKPAKPEHYRYLMPLEAPGKGGLVALRLPPAVYLQARGRELEDVRLFDAQGRPLRFALHYPEMQNVKEQVEKAARIFPLYGESKDTNASKMALDIDTDEGQVRSVRLKSQSGTAQGLHALFLDLGLGQEEKPLFEELRLQAPPGSSNYSVRVWLAVSDDLQQWETIASADLRWLQNSDGQTLQQDRLRFAARSFRYARLSFEENGKTAAKPFSTAIFYGAQTHALPGGRDSVSLQAQAGALADTDLMYQVSRALPVYSMRLEFSEPQVVLPLTIGTYRDIPAVSGGAPKRVFHGDWQHTFYRMQQGDAVRVSGDVRPGGEDRQDLWVFRANAPLSSKPVLRIEWAPAQMLFLHDGNGPYQLAFGRADDHSAASPLHQVAPDFQLSELEKLPQVKAGEARLNPAAQVAQSEVERAGKLAQRNTWLLWGVLCAGVLLLGGMVWRLLGQMRRQDAKQDGGAA